VLYLPLCHHPTNHDTFLMPGATNKVKFNIKNHVIMRP
jgi:hypothetical protein